MMTKALDGWYPHQPPYGYKNNKDTKRVEKDPIYFDNIKTIAYKFIEGEKCYKLAKYLNDQGLRTRGGDKRKPRIFTAKDVSGIIMRYSKFWAGKYDWGKERNIKGKHPTMISWEDHLLIQERFNKKEVSTGKPKQNFILNFSIRYKVGFLCCAECGERMKSCRSEGNGGFYHLYYCNNPKCSAKKKSIQRHELEGLLENLLEKITPTQRYIDMFKKITVEGWNNQQQEIEEKQKRAKKYKESLLIEKRETIAMRRREELELEDFKIEMERIKNELIVTKKVIEENQIDINELEALLEQAELFLSNIKPLYLGFNTKHKREFITIIFPEGIKYADGVLRTNKKSYLFEYLETIQKGEFEYVTPLGIEPRLQD
ncbi:recombinase family protein [Candidatus Dojkabacteria bacterium]|nr:recombinase family protein [Candidatus Dojkabacteria bacterium]